MNGQDQAQGALVEEAGRLRARRSEASMEAVNVFMSEMGYVERHSGGDLDDDLRVVLRGLLLGLEDMAANYGVSLYDVASGCLSELSGRTPPTT